MINIRAHVELGEDSFLADLNHPIDISLELSSERNARAWYVDLPRIEPVRTEHFTGSVDEGGSVNFRNIFFNPHGHGTHTECVGHITQKVHSINDHLTSFHSVATLITVQPDALLHDDRWMKKGDLVITKTHIERLWNDRRCESLIIRTTPNGREKTTKNYSNTNPIYIHPEAMQVIADSHIKHLLIDLPSVDRESDEGQLLAHKIFWNVSKKVHFSRTITEMIYVPNENADGLYLLELQVAPFKNDAAPSRPVLYPLTAI